MTKEKTYAALFWAIVIAFLYLGAPVLIPLALAGLLAALVQNLADWLERKGLPRLWASLAIVGVLLVVVLGFVLVLAIQVQGLVDQSQDFRAQFQEQFERLKAWISDTLGISPTEQEEAIEAQRPDGSASDAIMAVVGGIATVAFNTILVIVYTFLLLFYRDNLAQFVLRMVAPTERAKTGKIIAKSAEVSRYYVRGLFYMVVCLWVMYGLGFSLLGIKGALFFALLCGTLEIIPFVGNLVGNAVVVIAVLVQGGDGMMILGVVGIYLLVQLTQTYVLEPIMVGHQVKINALFTILGLIVGELIWGIAGLALAIPALGIVKIVCDHVPRWKPLADLLDSERRKVEKQGY